MVSGVLPGDIFGIDVGPPSTGETLPLYGWLFSGATVHGVWPDVTRMEGRLMIPSTWATMTTQPDAVQMQRVARLLSVASTGAP